MPKGTFTPFFPSQLKKKVRTKKRKVKRVPTKIKVPRRTKPKAILGGFVLSPEKQRAIRKNVLGDAFRIKEIERQDALRTKKIPRPKSKPTPSKIYISQGRPVERTRTGFKEIKLERWKTEPFKYSLRGRRVYKYDDGPRIKSTREISKEYGYNVLAKISREKRRATLSKMGIEVKKLLSPTEVSWLTPKERKFYDMM